MAFYQNLILTALSIAAVFVFAFLVVFIVLSWKLKSRHELPRAIARTVFLVTLPKETGSSIKDNEQRSSDPQAIKNQIALAEGLFNSIGGMRAERGAKAKMIGRDDHISFEIVAQKSVISFYLAVPPNMKNYVHQMILAQYPEANLEEVKNFNIFSPFGKVEGCSLGFTREYIFPIKTYMQMEVDPLNAITNSLSKIDVESSAAVQFVIRSAKKEWHRWGFKTAQELQKGKSMRAAVAKSASGFTFYKIINFFAASSKKASDKEKTEKPPQLTPLAQEAIKHLEEKTSKAGLDVNIRIIVSSKDESKAKLYLKNIAETFSQFNFYQYGNSLKTIKVSMPRLIKNFIYRDYSPAFRLLLNSAELASMAHLPTPMTETPNIKWLLAKRLPASTNIPAQGLFMGENIFQGSKKNIYIKDQDRCRHMYMIGMTGTGKSTLMENLAIQDIKNGHGVCVVDPHGTLIDNILSAVPKERAEDVVLFDASDTERPLGLNILEAKTPSEQDIAIQEMIAIFYKLVTDPSMIGPMFEHNMRNAMLTLMADEKHPGTIVDIPRIFTDTEFQKYKIKNVKDPLVRNFWEKEMAKTSDFHKSEMLGYLISKVGRFVENSLVRNIIGQEKSSFDFRKIMDEKKILLVNLSKGKIGEINSSLLGLILVSKLQMAALSRADIPEAERHDFYLYIDEFQNFITNSISIILAEARKYRLNLILAHQYLGQLEQSGGVEGKAGSSAVRDAIFGNVGSLICFRIGVEDAEVMAKQLAPNVSAYDLMNIEKYNAYVRLLIENQATKTFSMHCPGPLSRNDKLAAAIRELSRLMYGRPKEEIEEEILDSLKLGGSSAATFQKENSL